MKRAFLLAFFMCFQLFAADQTLIISGGIDSEKDFESFSKFVEKSSKLMSPKTQVTIIANSGFVEKIGKVIPATSEEAVIDTIQKIGERLERDPGKFYLFISDHGGRPDNVTLPLTTTISLFGRDGGKAISISYQKLKEAIDRFIPEESKLIILAEHCFSGAAHSLAFERPNSCAVSSTDFRTSSLGPVNFLSDFADGLFSEFKHPIFDFNDDGESSLDELFARIYLKDTLNYNRPRISSMDYIDYVQREHAYEDLDFVEGFVTSSKPGNMFGNRPGGFEWRSMPRLFFKDENFLNLDQLSSMERVELDRLFELDAEDLEILNSIFPKMKNQVDWAIEYWSKYKNSYIRYLNRYRDMKKRTSMDKLDSLKRYALGDIDHMVAAYRIVEDAKKVLRFYENFDQTVEWDRFIELTECEQQNFF